MVGDSAFGRVRWRVESVGGAAFDRNAIIASPERTHKKKESGMAWQKKQSQCDHDIEMLVAHSALAVVTHGKLIK